jgi:Alpha/beta hydrolase domain
VPTPNPTVFRDDLGVPVFVFETESDVVFSNLSDRQPDTNRFRLWEVAGSSHYDSYGLTIAATDTGDGQGAVLNLAAMQNPTDIPFPGVTCSMPINTGGTHWVLQAAVHSLNRWVTAGQAPPVARRLKTLGVSPVVFARDAYGNVLGGVRSPQVDAPVATLSGTGNGGNGFCFLFGTTVPFSSTQLAALYPNHREFVSRWVRSTHRAVSAGFLLSPDAAELNHSGAVSQIGKH